MWARECNGRAAKIGQSEKSGIGTQRSARGACSASRLSSCQVPRFPDSLGFMEGREVGASCTSAVTFSIVSPVTSDTAPAESYSGGFCGNETPHVLAGQPGMTGMLDPGNTPYPSPTPSPTCVPLYEYQPQAGGLFVAGAIPLRLGSSLLLLLQSTHRFPFLRWSRSLFLTKFNPTSPISPARLPALLCSSADSYPGLPFLLVRGQPSRSSTSNVLTLSNFLYL